MKDRLPISPAERTPLLDARREGKMTSSAHAYVRGSTKHFYEWLASARGRDLPKAPSIWICGDCHVGNLGPVAGKSGEISIELRDLDQTVIGSPAHDVTRLALSLAMAVRASVLPGKVTARVVESVARGYEAVFETVAAQREYVPDKPPAQVMSILRQAHGRSRAQLFQERLGKKKTLIPMGKRFWPLAADERKAVERLVATEKVRKLVTSLTSREDDAEIDLVDAAYWVKGCSSLGLWRAAVLVRVGGAKGKNKTVALLDVKEALKTVTTHTKKKEVPEHNGERVVAGARALSPALGNRMAPATVDEKEVFVRELLPQDLKFELESLREEEALAIAHYLAGIVAVAHARQLDPTQCAAWLEAFRKGNAQNLNAPAWLWAAVVDLVAMHEGAYLEHCRKHAMGASEIPHLVADGIVSHHVTGD